MHYVLLAMFQKLTASDEGELLERVARKDQKAFEELYDLYAKLVYSLIASIVKKQEEAEDVLQEVFVQVWERAISFRGTRGNVYSWLVALARNRAIDRIRSKDYRKQNLTETELDPDSMTLTGEAGPLDALVARERATLVKQALQQIPQEQRQVIEIAYFGGYSQSEIAEQLSIPLGTVKTRMRQGMKKLHTLLTERI